MEVGHSLLAMWPTAVDYDIFFYNQVRPIIHRLLVYVEESLQRWDIYIIFNKPDELISVAYFGKVEKCLVPCLHHTRLKISVRVTIFLRNFRFDREESYVVLNKQLVLILII